MVQKLLFSVFLLLVRSSFAQEPAYDHSFFVNSRMKGNYFYSKTSYQSPSWIKNVMSKLPVNEVHFFTPGNSLELNYTNSSTGKWSTAILKPDWRGQDNVKEGNTVFLKLFVNSTHTTATDLPAIQVAKKDSIFSKAVPLKNYVQALASRKWISLSIPLKDLTGISYSKSLWRCCIRVGENFDIVQK